MCLQVPCAVHSASLIVSLYQSNINLSKLRLWPCTQKIGFTTHFLFTSKSSGLSSAFLEPCVVTVLLECCCSGAPEKCLSGSICVGTLSKLKRGGFFFFFDWKKAGFANNVTFSNLISAVTRENQYFVGYLWAICTHTELCHRNLIANHCLQLMMETIQTSPNEASTETKRMNHRESAVCSMFNFLKSSPLKCIVVQRGAMCRVLGCSVLDKEKREDAQIMEKSLLGMDGYALCFGQVYMLWGIGNGMESQKSLRGIYFSSALVRKARPEDWC